MSKIYILLFQIVFIISNTSSAKNIEGYVFTNKKTPIAFVNVSVKGTTTGTVTNSNGYFNLNIPKSYNNKSLAFSFIGYESKEYKILDITKPLTVELKSKSVNIQEVVINPDSTMFTLLKRAYKKIPENYGTLPSLLTGFYRELLKEKDSTFLYIAESVIESYKTSYKNRQTGQVKVLKTRKNIAPNMQKKSNVKFYGGLYVAHSFDIVHNREGAIKPGNFNRYKYEYNGIKAYGNKLVYAFSYSRADSNINGNFYIDKESLAYVYYDYNNYEKRKSTNFQIKRDTTIRKIQYSEIDGKWFFKSCVYTSNLTNTTRGTKLVSNCDYVTTNVAFDNLKVPSYSEQIEFGTIFSDIATTYNKSYWKDYNILEQDSLSETKLQLQFNNSNAELMLNRKYEEKKSFLDIFTSVFLKVYFDFSLGYGDYAYNVNNNSFIYNGTEVVNNNVNNEINIVFNSVIGYNLTKKLSVEYKDQKGLNDNIANISFNLGMAYLIPIKRAGKQFFAQPSISYFNSYGGYIIGFADMPNPTTINNKTFKAGANIYSGKKYQGISTGIIFKTNITNMFHLVVGANYNFPVTTTDMFLFNEDKGLFKKKAYQTFNDNIEYYEDGVRKYNSSFKLNNWSISAGIRFDF